MRKKVTLTIFLLFPQLPKKSSLLTNKVVACSIL